MVKIVRLFAVSFLFLLGTMASAAYGLPALNQRILNYASSMMGYQDGNGECWTLVHHALQAAGANTDGDGNYVFGTPESVSNVIPGDVLQFEGVRFDAPDGSWTTYPH